MIKNAGTLYLAYRQCLIRREIKALNQFAGISGTIEELNDLGVLLAEISRPEEWIVSTPLYRAITDDLVEVEQETMRRDALRYSRG